MIRTNCYPSSNNEIASQNLYTYIHSLISVLNRVSSSVSVRVCVCVCVCVHVHGVKTPSLLFQILSLFVSISENHINNHHHAARSHIPTSSRLTRSQTRRRHPRQSLRIPSSAAAAERRVRVQGLARGRAPAPQERACVGVQRVDVR